MKSQLLTLALHVVAANAQAQGFGASAEVNAEVQSDEDSTGAVARTDVDPVAGLNAAVERLPGVRLLRTGALGSFTGLSVRGAELSHTTVLLDWLPILSPDVGAPDLGALPPGTFARAELVRGGTPLLLGRSSIGGVLRLFPPDGEQSRLQVAAHAGSFGAAGVQLSSAMRAGPLKLGVAADFRRADNDYPFLHDNATRFDPSDDFEARRGNADAIIGGLSASGSLRLSATDELRLVLLHSTRAGGVPGAGPTPARRARRRDIRSLGSVGYRRETERLGLMFALGGGVERHRFFDLHGEIGLYDEASDDLFSRAAARAGLRLSASDHIDINLVGSGDLDRIRADERVLARRGTSQRLSGGGGVEFRAHGALGSLRSAELRIAGRVTRTSTRLEGFRTEVEERALTLPDARLALGAKFRRPFTASASVAYAGRAPTMLELFGDRATLQPNPELGPERGVHVDVGVRFDDPRGRASVEVRGFGLVLSDLIRYRRTSQFTTRAENIASATIAGGEARAKLAWGPLRVEGAYTFMRTSTADGSELTWRPRHRLFAEASLRARFAGGVKSLSPHVRVRVRGAFFQDPANLVELPSLAWVDAGLALGLEHGLGLRLAVEDLFDARGQDFVGLPLPGRRITVSLSLERDLNP